MSTTELIIIVLIILLLFGGKKIPELMKGLGQGVKSFKQGLNEVKDDLNTDASKTTKADSAPSATRDEAATEKNTGKKEA